MRKKRGGTDSNLGTGTHPIKIYPPYNENSPKKLRRKCVYFESATKECVFSRKECVGPSNALCTHYCESLHRPSHLKINTVVQNDVRGVGMVVNVSDTYFRVKFVADSCEKNFLIEDIKKIKGGIIYV
jgi:hypothetical protein